jgi:hypothetical protein
MRDEHRTHNFERRRFECEARTRKSPALVRRAGLFEISDYLEDFIMGAGAGADALGQQEAARRATAAAAMASLAIFIVLI